MGRSVVFDLITRTKDFERGFDRAHKKASGFERTMGGLRRAAVGAFAGGAVLAGVKTFVDAATDAREVAEQTDAVLRSTKGAAGLSAKGFADLAASISKTVAVDDELIQSGENILATFTSVKGDIFADATQAAVDLAAAMNHGEVTAEGLQSANVQLGKALNDPIKGISALTRVGVSFTDQQKAQIKAMVEAGDTAGAQKVILAELSKEFGGSAEAAATSGKKLSVAWGNASEVLGNLLLPAIERGQKLLIGLIGWVDKNRGAAIALGVALATVAATMLAVAVATKVTLTVQKAAKAATIAWTAAQWLLNAALAANPVGLVIVAVAALVAGIIIAYKKSETFRKIVDAAFRAVLAAGQALWRGLQAALGAIRTAFGKAADFIAGAARRGFLGPIPFILARWRGIVDWFRGLPGRLVSAMGSLGKALVNAFGGALKAVLKFLGIKSPSSVFARIGRQMMAGLVKGVHERAGDVAAALRGVLGGVGQGGTSGPFQLLGQRMAAGYGWTGAQWDALRALWQHESGWNPNAQNPTSTAYGIAQFLDSTWASVGATKTSSGVGQIAAGLRYIKQRYGNPLAAWQAWLGRSPHWYGEGGIFTKPSIIGVGEKGPEAVIPLRGRGGGTIVEVHVHGNVYGGQRGAAEFADAVQVALLRKKRASGGIALGLG